MARSELEALKAQTAQTSAAAAAQDETARAAHERANTLARELAAAREEAEALRAGAEKAARAEAAAAEQGRALAEERQRVEGLGRDLNAARSELQALKAQTAQTSAEAIAHDGRELPKALGQPREAGISEPSASAKLIARAEQLLRDQDIGGARLLLERAAKSDNWAVFLLAETYDPQVLADRKVVGVSGDRTKARELYLRASSGIPEAQERAEGLRQQLAAARHEIETLKSNSADVDVWDRESLQAAQASPALAAPMDNSNALALATALIRIGNISSAQLLLERAMHTGSGRAAFLLAQTYDPHVLRSWKTYGARADPKRARELYGRAYDSGIVEAKRRAKALTH